MMDSASAYETHAHAFLAGRDGSPIGSRVVERWARTLPPGAEVLELACGGGYPVTQALHGAGLRLWAIDSSPTLVAQFSARFPDVPVQCVRVQESDFFQRHYDAAVAVGLLFLLPAQEQHALIAAVAQRLRPQGRFLFMAPQQAGTWTDLNTGLPCHSLGEAAYAQSLEVAGLRVACTFVDQGENHYYEAARP